MSAALTQTPTRTMLASSGRLSGSEVLAATDDSLSLPSAYVSHCTCVKNCNCVMSSCSILLYKLLHNLKSGASRRVRPCL